ncbi:MAG: ABC transporter ATP-binding protein [Candidatus Rokubacteria bacterium RIFCSPLOWO2_12_FULL_69_21]|nr:MAG: ABC transporter ATP-binding protein [Candidatus Rokubacteria bacterium RIFCSPLOWO2_12_FULL_69_21]
MLEVKELVTSYGMIQALKGVSLAAREGEVTCILGPNGAGKTTLLYTIAGILRPRSGSISFQGRELAGTSAPDVVGRGISLVPENRLVFPHMTARENLMAGGYVRLGRDRAGVEADLDAMFARFPILKQRAGQAAGTLSGGEQQMLAVARALMARPRLLMMDEPSLGLAPLVVEQIFQIVQGLNREGITVLLVEQNARLALSIAHHAYLLEQGRIAFHGTPSEVSANEGISRAYLGIKGG